MSKKTLKAKPGTMLAKIGLWATIWWAVSGVYLVLLVWQSRDAYSYISTGDNSNGFVADWWTAMGEAYAAYDILQILPMAIFAVWLVGGAIWAGELKRQKISFEAAFKDLFLTLRR